MCVKRVQCVQFMQCVLCVQYMQCVQYVQYVQCVKRGAAERSASHRFDRYGYLVQKDRRLLEGKTSELDQAADEPFIEAAALYAALPLPQRCKGQQEELLARVEGGVGVEAELQ